MLDENWKVLVNRFKKVDIFREKQISTKIEKIKKNWYVFLLFLYYFTLFQKSKHFAGTFHSSINLFFLRNMSQKVEMVWSVDQICQTKVFRFWFWNFKTNLFCSLIFIFLEHFWRFVGIIWGKWKNLLGKFVVNKINSSYLGSVIS